VIAPTSHAGRPKMIKGIRTKTVLIDQEEKDNKVITGVRGKVEAPYGWVKSNFAALAKPFYKSEDQHDYLVWTVFVVYRMKFQI
jgi:hypothetical protein